MRRVFLGILVLGHLASLAPNAVADSSTSPGRNAVYVSHDSVALPTADIATVASGTITAGRKKRVLEVDATVVDLGDGTNAAIALRVHVNGLLVMEPLTISQTTECQGTFLRCTTHGQFWLDLDSAELANPGVFIGQPLVIDLQAVTDGTAADGAVSLRARLQKK